jgi:protein TonB
LPPSRIFSLVGIVLAHLGLFYALEHGLISHAVQMLPKEVILTMIQPQVTPPEPPKPEPVAMKKLVTLQAPVAPVPEFTPVVNIPLEQHQIAVPAAPQPVQLVAKAEPAVVAAPVAMAQPKQISAVEYIRAPQPDYPPLARRMGEEGKVTLRVLVNEKGQAEKVDIQKSSGSNRLDEAARTAILRAIFKPYLEDGKALTVIATATISFSLSS